MAAASVVRTTSVQSAVTSRSSPSSKIDGDIAKLLAFQKKHPILTSSDSDSIRTFLKAWQNYKTYGSLSLLARTALELVYADQLYGERLTSIDENLEVFLRSIIPTPTLDDIQPYFDCNVRMAPASANTFHAHPLSAFNAYYNKFIDSYSLFQSYFDDKMITNPRGAMRFIQTFFVQGLQPRGHL